MYTASASRKTTPRPILITGSARDSDLNSIVDSVTCPLTRRAPSVSTPLRSNSRSNPSVLRPRPAGNVPARGHLLQSERPHRTGLNDGLALPFVGILHR